MTREGVLAAITRTELFAGLPHAELEALADRCGSRRVEKGGRVFARGDEGDCLYIVAQGSVALSASTSSGNEVVLAVLFAPQSFGELAVLDGGPRVADAAARQRTVLVTVPGTAFRALLARSPAMAVTLIKALTRLIRDVDELVVDLALVDLNGRVARYLLAAANWPDARIPQRGWVDVDLPLSQTELARMVGGSRQNVNRIIVSLERNGAIARSGSRVVSVRPDLLASTVDSATR